MSARTALGVTIASEPGDFLVKEMGVLLTEVVSLDDRDGHRFVGVDAGFNVAPERRIYDEPIPLVLCRAAGAPGERRVTVAGNINEGDDLWAEDLPLPEVREACRGKVVVSTVVPLTFGGPRLFTPPAAGSSAEEVQSLLPEARVVAAFHHIAAHELADAGHPIECDLLICGRDATAKETVSELGRSMGLRVLDVGALSNAGPLEGITAVLATINRRYKLKNSGIKITGLP